MVFIANELIAMQTNFFFLLQNTGLAINAKVFDYSFESTHWVIQSKSITKRGENSESFEGKLKNKWKSDLGTRSNEQS